MCTKEAQEEYIKNQRVWLPRGGEKERGGGEKTGGSDMSPSVSFGTDLMEKHCNASRELHTHTKTQLETTEMGWKPKTDCKH